MSPGRIAVATLTCIVLAHVSACSTGEGTEQVPSTASATAAPTGSTTTPSAAASRLPAGWVEDEVTFDVDGVSVHGTYRHPTTEAAGGARLPAALLIAGSGPTDRNGNSRMVSGSFGTLESLAGVLSDNGLASLRYDKLGSGSTGLGRYATELDSIGLDAFTHEAQAALRFLSERPGVDRKHLSVYGHSEGALFALLLATNTRGSAPKVHSVGLLEPLSKRYLDVITEQVVAQAEQQRTSGQITQEQSDEVTRLLTRAVQQLRSKGTVPANMGYGLGALFAPSSLKFLREADAIDPATLGAKLPTAMPVLVTCSDADIQVSCNDVEHLTDAITGPGLEFVHLTGVDHVLKEDASRNPANYVEDLPFSTQLIAALRTFAAQ